MTNASRLRMDSYVTMDSHLPMEMEMEMDDATLFF
jgi:hypothetical protein